MRIASVKRRLNGTWGERAGRAGLLARAVLYGVVGILAMQVALGDHGEQADKSGAFEAIADQPLGRALLALLALGLAGYAAWRFAQAFLDRGRKGKRLAGLAVRGGYLVRGLWYAGLAAFAASRVAIADETGGSQTEQRLAADAMSLPLGRELVAAVGVGLLAAAAYNGYRAVTLRFEEKLRKRRMSKPARGAAKGAGVLGHLARLVVFGLLGTFLVKAAWEYEPSEARGLDGALAELAQTPFGTVVIGALALGLMAYAVWTAVEARYRDV